MIYTWKQYWHWVATHHGKHPKPSAHILHLYSLPNHLYGGFAHAPRQVIHIGTAIHMQAGFDWPIMLVLPIFLWLLVRKDVKEQWQYRKALREIHEDPAYYRELPQSPAPTIDDPTPRRFVNEVRHKCGCVTRFDCTHWQSQCVTPCDDHFLAYVARIGGRSEGTM